MKVAKPCEGRTKTMPASRKVSTPTRQEPNIQASGKVAFVMAKARWNGLIVLATKASGNSTRRAARENSFIPTAISTRVVG